MTFIHSNSKAILPFLLSSRFPFHFSPYLNLVLPFSDFLLNFFYCSSALLPAQCGVFSNKQSIIPFPNCLCVIRRLSLLDSVKLDEKKFLFCLRMAFFAFFFCPRKQFSIVKFDESEKFQLSSWNWGSNSHFFLYFFSRRD